MYAIDTSNKISSEELRQLKQFAKASLDYFTIKSDEGRFGLISFGSETMVINRLTDNLDKLKSSYAIDSIERVGGRANFAAMFSQVSRMMGSDTNSKKLSVIFTKSDSSELIESYKRRLEALKSQEIKSIFVVIGDGDVSELKLVNDGLVSALPTTEELPSIYPKLEEKIAQARGTLNIIYSVCEECNT